MMKKVFRWATVLIAVGTFAAAAGGQNSLPVCTASPDNQPTSCTGGNWSTHVQVCEHLNVTCPGYNVADLGITIGYAKPSGTANGTIVFLSPEGGTAPYGVTSCPYPTCYTDANYFDDYLGTYGFEVMQTAWDSGWEDTGLNSMGQENTREIGYAAARAAAFLSWVDTNIYGTLTRTSTAGMCAQGNSAGGGEIAYILAWYGGYSYLNHAAFLSSPPLSNIDEGCATNHEPVNPIVTVCPAGQLGCGSTAPWYSAAVYSDALGSPTHPGVRQWSDDPSLGQYGVCQGTAVTSTQANTEWQEMSIVDGNVNTFNYPQTSMTAWLCSSVYDPSDGLDDGTMNNSSGQAQLFFANFTSASQVLGLTINGVAGCNGVEDVTNSYPTRHLSVIEGDMVAACVKPQ